MSQKIRGFEIAKGFEDKGINLPKRSTSGAAGYDFEAAEDIIIPSMFDIVFKYKAKIEEILEGESVFGRPSFGDADSHMEEEMVFLKNILDSADVSFEDFLEKKVSPEEVISNLGQLLEEEGGMEKILGKDKVDEMFGLEDMFKPVLVPTGVKAYMLKDERLELFNRSSNPIKNKTVLSNGVGLIDSDYYSNPDNDGHIMFQFVNYGPNELYIKKGDRIGQGVFSKYLLTDDDSANGVRVGGHGSTGV